jgi:hypothetical protein
MTALGAISVEDGAKTSVYLACSPEVKNITGVYFDKCKPKEIAKRAKDISMQQELWRRSEELCPLA